MKYCLAFITGLLICIPNIILAQDADEGQLLLFEPYQGTEQVQAISGVLNMEQFEWAKHRYLQQTLAFYQIIADHEADFSPQDALHPVESEDACRALNKEIERYYQAQAASIKNTVEILSRNAPLLSDAQKSEWALMYQDKLSQHPLVVRAQGILYECLYKFKRLDHGPMNFRFDRSMRKIFDLHAPLMDAMLGNVD